MLSSNPRARSATSSFWQSRMSCTNSGTSTVKARSCQAAGRQKSRGRIRAPRNRCTP